MKHNVKEYLKNEIDEKKENKIEDLNQQSEPELIRKSINGYLRVDEKTKENIVNFSEGYKTFLKNSKTERKTCIESVKILEKNGFKDIESFSKLNPGDKIYTVIRNKCIVASVIGNDPIINGLNIIGSHCDSPRIDLKPHPLIQNANYSYLKTQYYGGIKKYQWMATPLSIYASVIKKNGEKIEFIIGEDENDPCFCITDLLPHLARDQMLKKMADALNGENLNVLMGSMACKNKEKDSVKYGILKILYEKFGMTEEDFVSSEFEIVPSFNPKDVGLDKSMLGAYGQDDRVCCFSALKAICDIKNPQKTCVLIMADKEEIGSVGSTGMKSRFFEDIIIEIFYMLNEKQVNRILRKCFKNSLCISADVCAAYDPLYAEVFDITNSAMINSGVAISKYDGGRGKGGGNDASAETVGKVRKIFNDSNIVWQSGGMGKVDIGGGGTIAGYFAEYNIETLDIGVPILSMHAPFEVSGKLDIYMAYLGYLEILKSK